VYKYGMNVCVCVCARACMRDRVCRILTRLIWTVVYIWTLEGVQINLCIYLQTNNAPFTQRHDWLNRHYRPQCILWLSLLLSTMEWLASRNNFSIQTTSLTCDYLVLCSDYEVHTLNHVHDMYLIYPMLTCHLKLYLRKKWVIGPRRHMNDNCM
jgi:hypothetical protein